MNKNEEKRKAMIIKIVETTLSMIREMGYDNVTLEGIAKECDITKRTLYKYFHVKEAILGRFIQQTFALKKYSRIDALKAIEELDMKVMYYMTELMEGVLREPVIFERYLKYAMASLVETKEGSATSSGIGEPLEIIIADNSITKNLSKVVLRDFFMFAFIEMAKTYYGDPETFDLDIEVNRFSMMFVKGVTK